MSGAEEVWRRKTDDEILAAADRLAEYTEDGERVIRAEIRRRGFDEPIPTIRRSDPDIGQATDISIRYRDAYRVASAVMTFGTTVKIIGVIIAVVMVGAGLASSDGPLGNGALIGGVLGGAVTGLVFWILGVFITAHGQLLRASLDTAVNGSPLLNDVDKAKIMGCTVPGSLART